MLRMYCVTPIYFSYIFSDILCTFQLTMNVFILVFTAMYVYSSEISKTIDAYFFFSDTDFIYFVFFNQISIWFKWQKKRDFSKTSLLAFNTSSLQRECVQISIFIFPVRTISRDVASYVRESLVTFKSSL